MFDWKFIVTSLTNRYDSLRRINVKKDRIEDVLSQFIINILYINETVTDFNDIVFEPYHKLDELFIIDEFKDFITPKSVRKIPGDLKTEDVLVNANYLDIAKILNVDPSCISYQNYLDLQIIIRGWTKRDCKDKVVSLSSLKVQKSINDLFDFGVYFKQLKDNTFESFVKYEDSPFIPVCLKYCVIDGIVREDYFNTTVENLLQDYLSLFSIY